MDAIWLLFSTAWKAALLVGMGALLIRFWPRSSAAERHGAWVVVFVALLALPFVSAIWSFVPVSLKSAPAQQAFAIYGGPTVITVLGGGEDSAEAVRESLLLLVGIWAAGAIVMLFRVVLGRFRTYRYLRGASDFTTEAQGWRAGIPVRCAAHISMPMVVGIGNPCIMLPGDAPHWDRDQLRRVLTHEAAHIERKDPLWQLLGSLVAAFYWFHPAVRLALGQFSFERERACDDMVLAAGHSPYQYAEDLVELARALVSSGANAERIPEAAILMASPSRLELRVSAILDRNIHRQTPRRSKMITYTIALALLLLPLSALQSVAQQSAPGDLRAEMQTTIASLREAGPGTLRDQIEGSIRDVEAAVIEHAATERTLPAMPASPSTEAVTVAAQDKKPTRISVGDNAQEAKLIKKVLPKYPASAKAEGVAGVVRLKVRINKEGFVAEAEVESSPDERLSESALEAVNQWVYAPTLLNGEPVEIITVINVNYTLQK